MDDNKKNKKVIDVTNIKTSKELHEKLKIELHFPDIYGMNWDAFWDSITGLVELPESILIKGWNKLVQVLTHDAQILKTLFQKFNDEYPICICNVEYS